MKDHWTNQSAKQQWRSHVEQPLNNEAREPTERRGTRREGLSGTGTAMTAQLRAAIEATRSFTFKVEEKSYVLMSV